MSISLAGAIKTYLESTVNTWKPDGVSGCPIFRDRAPDDDGTGKPVARPYIVVHEGISLVVEARGGGAAQTATEQVQIDIWQQWRSSRPGDTNKENPILTSNIQNILHMVRLPAAPKLVFFTKVYGATRILEVDNNMVHGAITLNVKRLF